MGTHGCAYCCKHKAVSIRVMSEVKWSEEFAPVACCRHPHAQLPR